MDDGDHATGLWMLKFMMGAPDGDGTKALSSETSNDVAAVGEHESAPGGALSNKLPL